MTVPGGIARLVAVAVVLAPGGGAGHGAAVAGPALDDHTIELAGSIELAIGETRAVSLTVVPRPGFRISTTGPLTISLSLAPPAGATLIRRRLRRADAADPRAEAPRFDLGIRGEAAGDHVIAVDARFWVCGRFTCRPVRAARAISVRVAQSSGAGG